MIWPAMDLMGGACVRLRQGDFDQKTTYDADPLVQAQAFAEAGAQALHVVDLDGARAAEPRHGALIGQIARSSGLMVQTGGGIRQAAQIEALLEEGIARVVIGSMSVTHGAKVRQWLRRFGKDSLVLAFDVHIKDGIPVPAIHGWQERSATDLWQTLAGYADSARHILVTDIGRDGMLGGPNIVLYADIKRRFDGFSLLASGGIGALDDIGMVRSVGADGVIIGKALYEGRFTLQEALSCWPGA